MGVGLIFIMMILIIPIIVGSFLLILGSVSSLFLPFLIKELKYIIELYFNMKLKDAVFRHLIHFLFFMPIVLFLLFVASNFDISYLYIFSLVVFLGSSFLGFYIFLYFLFSIQHKNMKKVIVALVLGGGVFIFFAPSGYYTLLPIYNYFTGKENIALTKSIKNENLVNIFKTSTTTPNMSTGEKERIERFKELEDTRSYNYYLNMKPSLEVSNVKMINYYEDFLVAKSSYEFIYLATPKYFKFLAKHDKYPKKDPKNVPVHKVSCRDFSKSKAGDECYFGVLYPYFHNIIYTPKTKEVKHSVGYYCW